MVDREGGHEIEITPTKLRTILHFGARSGKAFRVGTVAMSGRAPPDNQLHSGRTCHLYSIQHNW
jgi:hypothetical protein